MQFLPAALESILQQDAANIEVLLIDNSSTDGISDYTANLNGRQSPIKLIVGKDKGIYDAMNKGIQLAAGKWLYFMGADDTIADDNVLQQILPELTEANDIVYGDCIWMPEGRKEEGEWSYHRFITANINHQRIFYKKSLFEKYGFYNIKYSIAADHELNIRFFCNKAIQKKYLPLTISRYHSGGFSAQKFDEAFWNDWDDIVLKNFKPYLPKKIIYGSLGTYIRHLADKGNFKKAISLLCKNFYHTRSLGFAKLMAQYLLFSKKNYAG